MQVLKRHISAARQSLDLQVLLSEFFTGGIARMRQTGHTLQSQLHAAGLALKVWQAQKELETMEK